MTNRYFRHLILLLLLSVALVGCGKDDSATKNQEQIFTAKMTPHSSQLYFSGTISPLKTTSVSAPVAGVVVSQYFKYGHFVHKGTKLFEINSSKLEGDYQKAITGYISAKNKLVTSEGKYKGTAGLHKLGYVSDETLNTDKTTYENDAIALIQAEQALDLNAKKLGIQNRDSVKKLTLADIANIKRILSKSLGSITVKAPASGLVLFPQKSGESSASGAKVGTDIKNAGQAIATIGDMTGLSVTISVNEVNINQVKRKQKVTVTGSAFPGITLHGYVSDVDEQAKGSGGGLPTFPVIVIIPKLNRTQGDIIHVGMTAKVQLTLTQPPSIMIPINAVFQQKGQNMVKVKNPKTGETKDVTVMTGQTNIGQVEILKGLKTGDQIVVSH